MTELVIQSDANDVLSQIDVFISERDTTDVDESVEFAAEVGVKVFGFCRPTRPGECVFNSPANGPATAAVADRCERPCEGLCGCCSRKGSAAGHIPQRRTENVAQASAQ